MKTLTYPRSLMQSCDESESMGACGSTWSGDLKSTSAKVGRLVRQKALGKRLRRINVNLRVANVPLQRVSSVAKCLSKDTTDKSQSSETKLSNFVRVRPCFRILVLGGHHRNVALATSVSWKDASTRRGKNGKSSDATQRLP